MKKEQEGQEGQEEKKESLEEFLDEITEEELDKKIEETLLEDVLNEEEIKKRFRETSNILLSNNSVSTLKNREILQIENLEEKVKIKEDDNEELNSQDIIKYGIVEDKIFDSLYIKPEIQNSLYDANKMLIKNKQNKIKDNINNISTEMAFVRKNMKEIYIKPNILNLENKKTETETENKFIKDFKNLSDDYKTQ